MLNYDQKDSDPSDNGIDHTRAYSQSVNQSIIHDGHLI